MCSGEPRCAPTHPDPTHFQDARLARVFSLGTSLGARGFLAVWRRDALHPPVAQGTRSWQASAHSLCQAASIPLCTSQGHKFTLGGLLLLV